jgi:hypothetical protein
VDRWAENLLLWIVRCLGAAVTCDWWSLFAHFHQSGAKQKTKKQGQRRKSQTHQNPTSECMHVPNTFWKHARANKKTKVRHESQFSPALILLTHNRNGSETRKKQLKPPKKKEKGKETKTWTPRQYTCMIKSLTFSPRSMYLTATSSRVFLSRINLATAKFPDPMSRTIS